MIATDVALGALEIVAACLNEVDYKDEDNTLALHILNVANVINTTSDPTQRMRSPIVLAAIWLDNIVINVISEKTGIYSPTFMYNREETELYVVTQDDKVLCCPILYMQSNGTLDVWRGPIINKDSYGNLYVVNMWFNNGRSSESDL